MAKTFPILMKVVNLHNHETPKLQVVKLKKILTETHYNQHVKSQSQR